MRVTFAAGQGNFEADEYALVCGVAGESHYLTFQRDAEGSAEKDWGIHLEYDDQSLRRKGEQEGSIRGVFCTFH